MAVLFYIYVIFFCEKSTRKEFKTRMQRHQMEEITNDVIGSIVPFIFLQIYFFNSKIFDLRNIYLFFSNRFVYLKCQILWVLTDFE